MELLGDDIWNCDCIQSEAGGIEALALKKMGCFPGTMRQATARSMHVGGINSVFCDGSVHFIGDFINVEGKGHGGFSVWDRLNLSSDGSPIATDAY